MERAMKIQEVILRAISKQINWLEAAEIIGISPRSMRRWKRRYEEYGYDGLYDRRLKRPRSPAGTRKDGGRYFITGRATETLKTHDENLKARLTSWLIEQHRLGVDCPKISPTSVDEIEQRRSLSVHQRADNLLRYIQKQTPNIGIPFSCHIDETNPTFYGNAGLVRIHEDRRGPFLSK